MRDSNTLLIGGQQSSRYSVCVADYRTERTIGGRIQAARKARGIKSTRELAELIGNDTVSVNILQNIESGRMTNLSATQLLNISYALKVAPSFLLTPMGDANGDSDLPGLSAGLSTMRPNEFDAWLTGSDGGAYRPSSAAEMAERNELAAFRELDGLLRERRRLQVLRGEAADTNGDTTEPADAEWNRVNQRLSALEFQIGETRRYLDGAGWATDEWIVEQ
jgi:transcriptional regulator with XRE-family HTH domain